MPKDYLIDTSGKSKAIFLRNKKIIDNNKINELIKFSKSKKKSENVRYCLHKSPSSKLHSMINLIYKNNENFPHVHAKDEVYHLIRGRLKILLLDKKLKVKEKIILNKDNRIYYLEKNIPHLTIPISKFVIFHETRIGPFKKKENIQLKRLFKY